MEISWLQAALLGFFACLASMPGMGGTVIGNYTLGRPLVGGLVCGIILGDIKSGILIGTAMQVVYIALVTPGGTVLFYGTATINLAWQHIGWKAVEQGDFHKLYMVDMGLPWISHIICSFLPTLIMCKMGAPMVELIKVYLPMDGLAMQTLFTVGALLPAVGVAILLKQVADSFLDFIPFFLGFALAAGMGLNLIGAAIVGGMFAIINYKIQMLRIEAKKAASAAPAKASSDDDDDDEEDI